MKRLLNAHQMRQAEKLAEEQFGMPPGLLMENAGAALAEAALTAASADGQFLVICGRGNNGGDGLAAARKLAARGRRVRVEVLGGDRELTGEPARNAIALASERVEPAAIPPLLDVGPGDVVIDALFGTGLNRAPHGAAADAIDRIASWRRAGAKVVAADLPSGLDADRGHLFEPSVAADVTVTFGYCKVGLALEPGASRSGRVECAPIGLPTDEQIAFDGPRSFLAEEADIRERLPKRESNSHKGTYGHVLVIAGSRGKSGAAALAGMGSLRSGAGLVTIATRPDCLDSVLSHGPELMGIELRREGPLTLADLDSVLEAAHGKNAIVVGPGIPRGDGTLAFLSELIGELSVPCVLDADALNALSGRTDLLADARAPLILTPHPGEMSRLVGKSTSEVQADRLEIARTLAMQTGATVVLKGARTVIAARDGTAWVNPTGNPGMATGGTGDVLSGICGGLVAQGLSPSDAALVGAYVHGLAGDRVARTRGQRGLIASDLLSALGDVWSDWHQ